MPYRPLANLVSLVLGLFALASATNGVFRLLLIPGEGKEAKAMADLIEHGVEVQAKPSNLVPIGTSVYSSAVYVFESPHGSGSHRVDSLMGPLHVVGERFPLVFDPRNTKRARLGPMAAARREHKTPLGFKRSAQRSALLSGAVCALAMVGLIAGA